MTPERLQLVRTRLARRQPDLTVLLDRVHKTHNFSAVLRSADAVGVYRAHAVPPEGGLPIAGHTAQGAQKWVQIQRHPDIETACRTLKSLGFRLFAAHLAEDAVDFREPDFTRPTAFVLGTEKFGVSEAALAACDTVLTIPMQGMVESLNVSVAAALLLFEAQRQRLAAGMYNDCRLSEDQYRSSLFEWLHPRIARYCRERKLPYPKMDEDGEVAEPFKGTASDPW